MDDKNNSSAVVCRICGITGPYCSKCHHSQPPAKRAPACPSCNDASVIGTPGAPCPFCATPQAKNLNEALERLAKERAQGEVLTEFLVKLGDKLRVLRGLDRFEDVRRAANRILALIDEFATSQPAPTLNSAPQEQAAGVGGPADLLRDMLAIQEACGLHTDEYAPGSVIEYIKELEAERAAVPEGWKLVPVEVTNEMSEAFAAAEYTFRYEGEDHPGMLYEFRHQYAAMLAAAPSPAPAQPVAQEGKALDDVQGWISVDERLPEVPKGDSREFIIACRRANGRTYVFAAEYLNAKLLLTDDEDCPEDGKPFSGWYQERDDSSGEYDTCWNPVCQRGDVVTHWHELPKAPSIFLDQQTSAQEGGAT